jgi:hypothetical protein
MAAGQPERALAIAMRAATDATSSYRLAEAREYLFAVRDACDLPQSDPEKRSALLELIGDVSTAMGRPREAVGAYRAAVVVARRNGIEGRDRLAAKLAKLSRQSPVRRELFAADRTPIRLLLNEFHHDLDESVNGSGGGWSESELGVS